MFTFNHCNLNVLDLEKSLAFYRDALGLTELRRKEGKGFTLAFLGDGKTDFRLELTCLHDRKTPYELGDNESHIAFTAEDYAAAHDRHARMGCICYENPGMGIYFIHDPDDYWLEIVPNR